MPLFLLLFAIVRLDEKVLTPAQVDAIVERAMQQGHVTGLAVAIINGDSVVHLKGYGQRNADLAEPFTEDTVTYGASLTKAAFGYMTMQLVAEGILDLDKPVVQYLKKPWTEYPKWADLAADPRAAKITARMLLSHTAGFANFRIFNPKEKLLIVFEPGSRYAYSGEGINLLQFIIEEHTGQDVGALMQKRVFDRFGMKSTSMTWRDEWAANLAVGHDERGKNLGHNKRQSARAAGSMDTTLRDYAAFLAGLLKEGPPPEMIRTQIRIRTRSQFPTLRQTIVADNDKIRLGYGLGWGVFETPYGKAFFKEGHDDGWRNHAVCFLEKKTCLLLLSNSSNANTIFKTLLDQLIADRFTPWQWEGYLPAVRQ